MKHLLIQSSQNKLDGLLLDKDCTIVYRMAIGKLKHLLLGYDAMV
ncbi:MAG: hypothetical protein AAF228_13525 [Pseudomonadota bacterium]